MKERNRFIVAVGCIIFGFAYSINGFDAMAILCGCLGVFASFKKRYISMKGILCVCAIELLVVYGMSFQTLYETLPFMVFCNSFVSVTWMQRYHTLHRKEPFNQIIHLLLTTSIVLILGIVIIPCTLVVHATSFLTQTIQTVSSLITLVCLVFGPLLILYGKETILVTKRRICKVTRTY